MTRYPKSGKGRKWTIVELKAIDASWRDDALADGEGLVGTVRVAASGAVSVHFRYGFRRQGKRAWHYCGTWPMSSLESIRRVRDDAQTDARAGVDPTDKRVAVRIENQQKVESAIRAEAERNAANATFREMFEQWVGDGVARKDGNAEIRRSFERDVLPSLGDKPARLVSEHDLRTVLRQMVGRGVNRMAVVVSRDLRQMYGWAEKRQPWRRLLLEGNPASLVDIEQIVAPDYDLSNVRHRVLDTNEIRELQAIFSRSQADYDGASDRRKAIRPLQLESQIAVWLCLATCCRIGELLMARWEHVDLDAGSWFIPKDNVKGVRGKKQDHLVFLSDFAAKQFRSLRAVTGNGAWCFPSRDGERHVSVKTVSKQVGDRQERFKNRKALSHRRNDDVLVLGGGRAGEWTPHDLRRTGATMMQALGVNPDVIDRCQNHVLAGSRIRRHYLKHEYAEEKRAAWARLGDEIEAILGPLLPQGGTPVVEGRRKSVGSGTSQGSAESTFRQGPTS